MATLTELKAFAEKTSYDIPYVDYQVGVPASVTSFKDYHGLPASGASITYNAANNTVYVTGNNLVVSGYDFSGTTLVVNGNNVTVQNSKFDSTFGWYALTQTKGFNGLVVDHNTFDGLKIDKEYARFINSGEGQITITYNEFKNAQTDVVELTSGVVDHNYFNGTGYQTGAHADAIWVYKTTGPVSITNNFVDSRQPADAPTAPNNTVQIVNKFGEVHDVTVTRNVLLGGSYTVNVNDITSYAIDTVKVVDNFVAEGMYGDLYPNFLPSDLVYSANSAVAITATIGPAVAAMAGIAITGTAGRMGEVLQGTDGSDHIFGHGDGNQLIGGIGRDFLFGGKGEDHFVYKDLADSSGKLTDLVTNFEDGIDKIDLHALATNTVFGNVPLTYLGEAAFNGTKGAVHAVRSGNSTFVEVDMNGDRVADMRIELQGSHALKASDFILTNPASPVAVAPIAPSAPAASADPDTTATIPPTPAAPAITTSVLVKGSPGKIGEILQGGTASDHIYGHGDQNRIIGGEGRDFLFGGKGEDRFVYKSIADSAAKAGDVIANFEDGIDKIDLHALATNTVFGNVPLTYLGEAAFNGTKGAVHAVRSGNSTFVEVDMNGDRVADMRIELQGTHHLSSTDFLL
jgi:serralysin